MFFSFTRGASPLAWALALPLAACGGDVTDPGDINDQEVITTITLTFTPRGGGAALTARFHDPDGDGGSPPTIDPITLTAGSTYAMALQFSNALATPPEDITQEIADEADEHQLFFTGDAVEGPATGPRPSAILVHAYDDEDADGAPIGLANTIVARRRGTGQLTVTLRHLPPIGGVAVKTNALAERVASGGIASLPGDTDASVSFDATVD